VIRDVVSNKRVVAVVVIVGGKKYLRSSRAREAHHLNYATADLEFRASWPVRQISSRFSKAQGKLKP
jgi:hypothetical protein